VPDQMLNCTGKHLHVSSNVFWGMAYMLLDIDYKRVNILVGIEVTYLVS
jgi:hypothetical protein